MCGFSVSLSRGRDLALAAERGAKSEKCNHDAGSESLAAATRLSTVRVQCCTAVRGRRATLVLASELRGQRSGRSGSSL